VLSVGATRWRQRRVLLVALAGAAVSALLMATLYQPEVDPSRLYFGTDTRATGLLMGAALAFIWSPWSVRASGGSRLRRRWGWTVPLLLDVAGLAALGGLVVFCLRLGEYQPFLYRGGLASVALASTVVIMACAHPHTRWIGLRSYGVYLWHWPVFMVTRPQLDVAVEGLPLLALRLAVTVVLADLSYRYVETPIRKGTLERAWRALREARRFRRRRLSFLWAGVAVPVLTCCAVLGVAVARAHPPEPPSQLLSTKAIHTKVPSAESTTTELTEEPLRRSTVITRAKTSTNPNREARTGTRKARAVPAAARPRVPVGPVSAVGDSVMLGAAERLERDIGGLTVMDAEVGLQASAAIDILRWRRASGQLGEVVIVHIGNNGIFTAEQFDEMMRVLAGVRRVVFVNVNVPRAWAQPNNEVLAEGVRRYPNAVLVDWYSPSVAHPEYFVKDGVHLQVKGQRVYADLISRRLEASRERQ
jgi:hypothetical protein